MQLHAKHVVPQRDSAIIEQDVTIWTDYNEVRFNVEALMVGA